MGLGTRQYVWNASTLSWVAATISSVTVGELSVSGVAISNFPSTQEISDNPLETWVSGTVTLTNADTAYKIPSSEQSGRRLLILYNGSDTDMKIGASTITTSGILLAAGATMAIAAGANLYAACASAGKVITYLEGK